MRIQEVMGKTGLSRRTIHYYIDQKLIIPPVNEGNGYHDFTEEDVQKLFIIRKLREAGLSLADIRAILRKPRTTPFYLHKQMNELQTQMLTIQKTISEMDRFSGQLPVRRSFRWNREMPVCWRSISGWLIWTRRSRSISSFCGRKSCSRPWNMRGQI